MQLDGDIARPKLDLALDSPMDGLGLAGVHLLLDPDASGFAWAATGQSHLGPFSGTGQILLPKGAAATIAINQLDVTGTRLAGALRSDPGGFTGTLNASGGGISGSLAFAPRGPLQQLETHLKFERATLAASTPVSVRRGTLDGTLVLDPAGIAVDGKVVAIGLRRGSMNVGQLGVNASLRGGTGSVGGVVSGQRGRAFKIRFGADLAPNRVTLTADGTVDRRPIKLETPAVLTKTADGWSLGRTQLSFAGGASSLSGHYGGSFAEVDASLDRMPLSVLDIANPELALGGVASGQFNVRRTHGGMPTGKADLRIRGLTRSGLVLSSRPIDLGLVVLLNGDTAAARAVAMSEGKEIGRAQAKLGPMGSVGRLRDRLLSAPLFAQLRYNGPADTLWRLTNNSSIDLSGPIAIGADVSGHVNDPVIRGSLRANGARLESGVTGTIIEQIQGTGRFGGSQLTIDNFSGNTHGGGSLTGHGTFDLASAHGFGMDLSFDAQAARILNRDDIAGIITGPMSIKSDGSGGLISGKVRLDRGRFRLGRASAAAITRLNITELNRPPEENEDVRPQLPWRLDLSVDAPNQLAVTGLGLDSEWRGRLHVGGTVENPAIKGTIDLVRGGYQFAGKRFNLDRGQIRFLGEAPPDPVIDISASANVQGLSATIHVVGTGQKPEINFTSVPAMPEDELLSRLLFGDSITNLSAPEALQLAAAVASLRGGGGSGLDPINAIRRAVGLDRLRVLPADATTKQGTSVAAGKYIGKRTYVELITDGQGYSATNIEFQITRWLSLLSTISTVGRQSASVRVSKDY
jgi:translocation and assembly module TamB